MYKVLLIDDEEIVLKGLQSIIAWEDYDCEICGVAETGKEGLEKIRNLQPDIVFTDICMNDMTGLDMLEQASDELNRKKVIVITGYREFEYAKKALTLGVDAFILKPTKISEIKNVLEKVVAELDEEKVENENRIRLEEELNENRYALRERAFSDIVSSKNEEWLSYNFDNILSGIEYEEYVVITTDVQLGCDNQIKENLIRLRRHVCGLFKDPYKASVIYPTISGEISLIISSADELQVDKKTIFGYIKKIVHVIGEIYCCKISVGISTIGHDINKIKEKYLESRQALEHRIYLLSHGIIYYDEIPQILKKFGEQDSMYSILLLEQIHAGDIKATEEMIYKLEEYIKNVEIIKAKKIIINIIYKMYDSYNMLQENGYMADNHKFIYESVVNCDDLKKPFELLRELAMAMVEKVRIHNGHQNALRLKRVCDYINDNYNKQITRTEIANHVNVTPNYLSSFFKKEMQLGLMDYVVNVRIDAAKRMLIETEYNISEIAYECGFQDIYYFSKMFKAKVDYTPREFRKINQSRYK